MFIVNVRSLNANHDKLLQLLHCLSIRFDVILSEIWSTNIPFYINLLSGYDFFSDLSTGRVGGVGIYINKQLNAVQTYKYCPPIFGTKSTYEK